MHHSCLKFEKFFWRGGKAPSPDPTPYPSAPSIPKFWIRRCLTGRGINVVLLNNNVNLYSPSASTTKSH